MLEKPTEGNSHISGAEGKSDLITVGKEQVIKGRQDLQE